MLGLQNLALEGFVALKWVFRLRNGTRVPEKGFAATKNFAEGGLGLRNGFVEGGLFRSKASISQMRAFGCEMVSQRKPLFAGELFWLRNFRRLINFFAFELLWFLETFLHFFCNSS